MELNFGRRSYKSRLTRMFREAQAACAESAATGMPIDEITDIRAERTKVERETRREFLRKTGRITAGAAALGLLLPRSARAGNPGKIVIVGGGLAGLRCAHVLWNDWGQASTVYEWDDHVGGRVETKRNFFANGQIAEMHGEFVSSEHASMLALASRFSLSLDLASTPGAYPSGTQDIYWFNGGYYTQAQLSADWQKFGWALFNNAVKAAPWPTRYTKYKQAAYNYDHTSVVDFINKYVPGGMNGAFGKLCYQDAISEYGGPPEQQSALNLIYILGYDDSTTSGRGLQPSNYPVLAGTDEKYHIKGGNDQIITGMLNELPAGTIQLGQKLLAVKLNSDGTYTCTFQSGSTVYDVTSINHVVLAIPFSTLRSVDLSKANISALKMTAINNLQLGNNLKVLPQFNTRVWNTLGYDGNLFGDTTAINWEVTNYQPGLTGILLNFQGGTAAHGYASKYGLTTDEGVAPTAMVSDTLKFLEPVWPGLTAAHNGLCWYNDGNIDPHLLGAWSQYNIGQYTGFSGIEPVQEGNIHFAGEQTSMNFQGFMEGGVTTGERVANTEIR